VKGEFLAKLKFLFWKGAGTVSGNSEASGWRVDGFTSAKVEVSAWPIGD
jgi:hypothetical protein